MKRILQSFALLLVAVIAVSGLAEDLSHDYADEALKRALATFAVARALNGVISVAQGTEVAVEPGGVGITMTPGQILDPVNDLVERFSGVMLVASSSLGLQIILLEIVSWTVLTVLLVASLSFWFASLWSDRLRTAKYTPFLVRLSLILAFVRFAVPAVIICTNFVFSTFLESRHESSAAELRGTTAEIEELNVGYDEAGDESKVPESEADDDLPQDAGAPQSESGGVTGIAEFGARVMDSAKALYAGVTRSVDEWYSSVAEWLSAMSISARMAQLQETASNATTSIVNLIVVFVLQTIVIPLVFLWLFVEALKAVASRSISLLSGDKT